MKIGIAKEIRDKGLEKRVILLPCDVKRLAVAGHEVFVEKGLGERIHISDDEYQRAGAKIVSDRKEIFAKDLVVKLRPPLPQEFNLLGNNLLFCMLHPQQNPKRVAALKKQKCKAVAMEMIRNGASERLVHCTEMAGEQGMIMTFHLADKIPVESNVLVLGYGAIASGAMKVAFNLGADVKILLRHEYPQIKHFIRNKDIVVNGLHWPEEKRQKKEYLITKDMLSLLNKGAIILDLSVDHPGPIETCHPTFLDKPVYEVCGIRHISIVGYPGLAPVSSAGIYSRQVLPVLLKIAATPFEKLPGYIQDAAINAI
ncbi:MAG: hypothetical protein ISS46_03595 [Candidatus Omnitrophica bacterium]|nr:hypothetical protein [Candidatus Omnitrophota bacterium]